MYAIYALISFLVGVATNVQSGVNGQIRLITGNAVFASFANFIVGTLLLVVLLFLFAILGIWKLPDRGLLSRTRWWAWMGGPLGLIYVMALVLLPPLIGYAAFFSMLVAGQLFLSVTLDHKGWLVERIRRVDKARAAGVLLLLAGAVLVQNS